MPQSLTSATLEIIVSSHGDAVAMMNEILSKSQSEERQYLKMVMECIQYLHRQRIALRGNDHIDDNLANCYFCEAKITQKSLKDSQLHQLPIKENIHTKTIKMSFYLSWQIKFFGQIECNKTE